MDKQFERLAKLVGEALARRWTQIMAKKRPRQPRSPRRQRRRPPPPPHPADGQA